MMKLPYAGESLQLWKDIILESKILDYKNVGETRSYETRVLMSVYGQFQIVPYQTPTVDVNS